MERTEQYSAGDRYQEAKKPRFPHYTTRDAYGSAKGLESKLLGEVSDEAKLSQEKYCLKLATKMSVAHRKGYQEVVHLGNPPEWQEIQTFFSRERVFETLGEHEQLTPEQQRIKGWLAIALKAIRHELNNPTVLRKELSKIRLNQGEPTAFAWNLSERFDLLEMIRSDANKQVLTGAISLIQDHPRNYPASVARHISHAQLQRVFLDVFDLAQMPEEGLEGLVCEPHLDREAFEQALHQFKVNLGYASESAIHSFAYENIPRHSGGIKATLFSTADTLIDYAGGVDAVIELKDEKGRPIGRIMMDITTNKAALPAKLRRINDEGMLVNQVLFFKPEDILPFNEDPAKPQILATKQFRKLVVRMSEIAKANATH